MDPTVSGRLKGAGRARGFSLIELMVALALGLIVTGSALTLVMTNRTTFAATASCSVIAMPCPRPRTWGGSRRTCAWPSN